MANLKKFFKKIKGKELLIGQDYPETLFSIEPQQVSVYRIQYCPSTSHQFILVPSDSECWSIKWNQHRSPDTFRDEVRQTRGYYFDASKILLFSQIKKWT